MVEALGSDRAAQYSNVTPARPRLRMPSSSLIDCNETSESATRDTPLTRHYTNAPGAISKCPGR